MIKKVSIIGSGNVATQLGMAFTKVGTDVTHVASRTPENAENLASQLSAFACKIEDLPVDQLAIVCVSDDAISEVLNQLSPEIPVAYTSGSIGIHDVPKRAQLGVFYPLQTLSKTSTVQFSDVPILIESENAAFQEMLANFARQLSKTTRIVNSEQRRKIHLAAVWINNFTNHVVYQAQKITEEQNLDYQLLLPLLRETLQKLENQPAFDAQTGPAIRGDIKTIEKHLSAQDGISKELYELLSRSIKETYRNEEL
ncbi:MAG: DUF2520 domain-containing protein [Crocinitomicaceae bacterium]